jgi:hypothetical protein
MQKIKAINIWGWREYDKICPLPLSLSLYHFLSPLLLLCLSPMDGSYLTWARKPYTMKLNYWFYIYNKYLVIFEIKFQCKINFHNKYHVIFEIKFQCKTNFHNKYLIIFEIIYFFTTVWESWDWCGDICHLQFLTTMHDDELMPRMIYSSTSGSGLS